MAEDRVRWTRDWSRSPFSATFADCSCGATAWVMAARVNDVGTIDRRLQCLCGRKWRQVIY